MSAQFVARALSYCLGKGTISLKGHRKRLWLELQRTETERVYLGSQVYQLRQVHPGPVEVFWDRLPTDGFYDIERARLQSDELWPAYDLLYPRDERTLSAEVLSIAGIEGLASLWLDHGVWVKKAGELRGRLSPGDKHLIAEWATGLGFAAEVRYRGGSASLIFPAPTMQLLKPAIRPYVHQTMRHKLVRKAA